MLLRHHGLLILRHHGLLLLRHHQAWLTHLLLLLLLQNELLLSTNWLLLLVLHHTWLLLIVHHLAVTGLVHLHHTRLLLLLQLRVLGWHIHRNRLCIEWPFGLINWRGFHDFFGVCFLLLDTELKVLCLRLLYLFGIGCSPA